jgi:hypothetical protein
MATRFKWLAIGKVALGSARIASGAVTAIGQGLLGGYCRNHNMMQSAMRLGQHSITGGMKMAGEGWKELNVGGNG